MNAQKLSISEQPTLVLKAPLDQDYPVDLKTSVFKKFLASLKDRLKHRHQSDLGLEEWRRLEYRNEWRAQLRDHHIKFIF